MSKEGEVRKGRGRRKGGGEEKGIGGKGGKREEKTSRKRVEASKGAVPYACVEKIATKREGNDER